MENRDKNAKYASVAEFAKMLGISRIAVFNRIKKGKIPAEKIGRAYAIPIGFVSKTLDMDSGILTEEKKKDIGKAVKKVVKEYGETLKRLGNE